MSAARWLESIRRPHWEPDPCGPRLRALATNSFAMYFPLGRDFADLHLSLYFQHPNLDAAYDAHDLRVRPARPAALQCAST